MDGNNFQSIPQTVSAFRWMGGEKATWPKWAQLVADEVDNSRHLWINSGTGGLARRGDWIVRYDDGTIEVLSEVEFKEQFQEVN